jgi:hypothetical protein
MATYLRQAHVFIILLLQFVVVTHHTVVIDLDRISSPGLFGVPGLRADFVATH